MASQKEKQEQVAAATSQLLHHPSFDMEGADMDDLKEYFQARGISKASVDAGLKKAVKEDVVKTSGEKVVAKKKPT